MKLSEKYLTKKDIDLANFAKAIALPVRVCIIRMIIENNNEASRVKLDDIPFSHTTISQHLTDLTHLGILKSDRKGTTYFYKVNEDVVVNMSNNFLTLFQPVSTLNEQARQVLSRPRLVKKPKFKPPTQSFGEFIREKRKKMGLTQTEFAKLIRRDRSIVSLIENNKVKMAYKWFNRIAEVLHVSVEDLNHAFYEDKLAASTVERVKQPS